MGVRCDGGKEATAHFVCFRRPLVASAEAIPFATNGTKQQKKKRMPLIH